MRTDRQKDMTELTVAFCNYSKAPKSLCLQRNEPGSLSGPTRNLVKKPPQLLTGTYVLSNSLANCYTVCLQTNGAVSKVNNKFISHLTRAKPTPSAAATVQVSHALPAVRFSCLLRGRAVSLQDGAAAGKGFLCAPF